MSLHLPTKRDVNYAVDRWRNQDAVDIELQDWLGWTLEEYHAWVEDPYTIPKRPLANP